MAWFQAATMSSLVVVTLAISAVVSTTEAADVVDDAAPSPAPTGPLNLTEILRKAAQYNAFTRLLKDTEVVSQVASLLDGGGGGRKADGVTVLAPTDAAFAGMRPGALNRMDAQAESQLVLFHILPKFYSFVTFETTTNPVRTQASTQRGVCTVNVTTAGGERQQVNVSSGTVEATLGRALYSAFPLAMYSVDTVLLPPDLFGDGHAAVKGGAEAPAPAGEEPQEQTPAKGADDTAVLGASTRTGTGWPAFAATMSAVALTLLVAC